jgi:AraC-like DNA-binding protein/catechol 2,3-dioxygenase-like lactoylglutathione lyase family enzyme
MARAAGLSRAHFSREFRRGVRRVAAPVPADPPARARRRRCCASTDRSVADICFSVGLQSVGSFTTSFTKTFGVSPTVYRAGFPPAVAHAVVPELHRARLRPSARQHVSRRQGGRAGLASPPMMHIANTQLWVHDQDEALAFYTDKLGWEVRADVTMPEMGDFRWLTVGPVGQEDFSVVLMAVPGQPVMEPETREQVLDLAAKGFAGTVFLSTDDVHSDYEQLKARGVEFSEEPEERPTASTPGSTTRRATRSGSPR